VLTFGPWRYFSALKFSYWRSDVCNRFYFSGELISGLLHFVSIQFLKLWMNNM
jgi:hypothetical protein